MASASVASGLPRDAATLLPKVLTALLGFGSRPEKAEFRPQLRTAPGSRRREALDPKLEET